MRSVAHGGKRCTRRPAPQSEPSLTGAAGKRRHVVWVHSLLPEPEPGPEPKPRPKPRTEAQAHPCGSSHLSRADAAAAGAMMSGIRRWMSATNRWRRSAANTIRALLRSADRTQPRAAAVRLANMASIRFARHWRAGGLQIQFPVQAY